MSAAMDLLPNADKQEPIAIVGVAFRFAGGVSSMGSLWDMISKVKTGHGPVPSDRWDGKMWHHPDQDRKGGIGPQHGYFLEQDISHFDAPFFSVTAKEASSMDPMKRMLLEVCYESIENAGIPVEDLMNSRTGCYVGCMTNDYEMISLHDIYDIGHPAATGLSEAMTANRVSCSSLYALHLACQSLRLKETNMSLVTGVNLIINPNTSHQLNAMHMLSPEGISHTFDDRANGYGRGDGIGSLVIKRLSDAIRDGDTIRAVIRGSGINADGKTPSVTQPSSIAQAELIRDTYNSAGLNLSDTGYFECHGTGTPVGDPLELTAIAQTLGDARRATGKPPLHIGSIKPTVGHTEGCAGLAGVFKSILLLEKGMLVPTYGVMTVNPKLKLRDWHLCLPQDVITWPAHGVRRISVNSFGFGGANAHVILDDAYHYMQTRGLVGKHNVDLHEQYSDSGISTTSSVDIAYNSPKKLIVFSGKDQAGAKRVSGNLATWLESVEGKEQQDLFSLDDLAYTLAMRRSHMEHRSFAVTDSITGLSKKLSQGLPTTTRSERHSDNLVMVFTGQGAQWAGMGRELFEHPIFRRSLDVSQSCLEALGCKWNAVDELNNTSNNNIDLPEYSQPLCTVIQLALVDLLRSWNITPVATIGHSSGEIAAAYAASFLTHQDAIKLAYVRGVSSAAVTRQGAMMAVGISKDAIQVYLEKVAPGSVVVACFNSPSSLTLSGDVDAIDYLQTIISADGIFARKLRVTTAYHSPHMREVSEKYLDMIGEITPKKPDMTTDSSNSPVMYSSLTGSIVSAAEQLNAQYWVDNMQNPVQFSQALSALLRHKKLGIGGNRAVAMRWAGFLEVGPAAALQGPVRQVVDGANNKVAKSIPYASVLIRGKDATETSLNACGTLWAAGTKVDLAAVNTQYSTTPQMLCDLPTYSWNHGRSFWHESYSSHSYRFPTEVRSDFLGMADGTQNTHAPQWRNYLRIAENPWIEDHVITGTVLYPGAGMLVMALEGVLRTVASSKTVEGFRMTDISFERGLVISLDEEAPVETRLCFHPHSSQPSQWVFTIYSMTKGSSWTKHCAGTISVVYETESSDVEESGVDTSWQEQIALHETLLSVPDSISLNTENFYNDLEAIGMQYGPVFRNVSSLTVVPSKHASYGTVAIPDTKSTMPSHHESPHIIHPATLDSIFHLVIASLNDGRMEQSTVPYSIEELYIAFDQPKGSGALYSGFGRMLSQRGREIITELFVSDQEWVKPKLTIKNFALRQITSGETLDTAIVALPSVTAIKNCAAITWTPDLSFLTSNKDLARLVSGEKSAPLDSFLDSVFLKKADNTVLVAMFDEYQGSIEILVSLKKRTYTPKKIIALTTSESGLQMMRAALGESSNDTTVLYKLVPESELLEMPAPEDLDLIIGLGVNEISKNAEVLSKLAPLACLTHTGQLNDDFVLPGSKWCVSTEGETSILFSVRTSSFTALPHFPEAVVLLLPVTLSDSLDTFATTIQIQLAGSGASVRRTHLTVEGVADLAGKSVISLLEIDNSLVYAWDEDQFHAFKTVVSTVSHLFWLTHGSVLESWSNGVEFATSQGLFRVMRNEYPAAILPLLDLSAVADILSGQLVDLVLDVWRTSLAEDAETEYAEHNGLVYVARATEDMGFDNELQLAGNKAKPIWDTLSAPDKPLRAIKAPNDSDGYIWIRDEEADLPLEDSQVEVKVEYAGLGLGKTLTSVHHAVGIVTRLGDSVKSLELGQRAVIFSHDAARTHIRQFEALVAPLPDNLKPQEAVSLVEPLLTAQYALIERAQLSCGQAVLLDNAASVVGQTILQLAKDIGADIFALVHSRSERDILVERYGISTDRIFDSALGNFVPLIRSATNSHGVDVIISQQKGSHIAEAMSILSEFGQFIDINGHNARDVIPASKSNATYNCINAAAVFQGRQDIVCKLFKHSFDRYILQGPVPLTVLPITDVSASANSIQAELVVLSLNDTTMVPMPAPEPERLSLDSEATYVLAGGLGALGLEIANWMVQCGAKSLVFLSRSGSSKHKKALQTFAQRSVHVEAFACNINDAVSVATVFASLKTSGKKVAGVIQLAMVLADGIFGNMTFDQWHRAIDPKTKGSRNLLANLWPGDKPFFILLSSITGIIGNTAQANYASGNTFEDALAHHARNHLGIKATSIDVGLVSDSAHFTTAGEFGDLPKYLSRYQHGWRGLQTNVEELIVVLRAIIRGSTANGQEIPAQVVLGLEDRIEHIESTGGFSRDKKFELRVVKVGNQAGNSKAKEDIGFLLSNAMSMVEAVAIVEENIKELVAVAMGIAVEEVDGAKPLYDYGVDSLQAVDIRNRALKNLRSEISVFDILSAMPLADVAAKIAANSQLIKVKCNEEE
ncbi:hypothetical protein VTL71DRAFT_15567 [Oculimacula yallundae]|uniref:Polyketide synthase n=1 Tax=Oculimacula yallundae TaxID=86028 RepID=A0ABR4CJB2_9HELO